MLQDIPQMSFAEILERTQSDELSQSQAASLLGMSERTFRRCRDRYEAEGAEGLYYRGLGKVSQRRMQLELVTEVLELFDIEGVMSCCATNGFASVFNDPAKRYGLKRKHKAGPEHDTWRVRCPDRADRRSASRQHAPDGLSLSFQYCNVENA